MLDLYRVAHFFAGFFSAFSVLVSPVLPIVCFAIFFSYECSQTFSKDDFFDEEMLEFGYGFFTAVILMLFLKLLGAI